MSYFTVIKFNEISTYGSNPYKCVPSWWVNESDTDSVMVLYPSKSQIFKDFKNIVNREPPIHGWSRYQGTIVHTTDTYHEGLQFIHTQDSSFIPEELIFVKYLSENDKTLKKRLHASRKLACGIRKLRRFLSD